MEKQSRQDERRRQCARDQHEKSVIPQNLAARPPRSGAGIAGARVGGALEVAAMARVVTLEQPQDERNQHHQKSCADDDPGLPPTHCRDQRDGDEGKDRGAGGQAERSDTDGFAATLLEIAGHAGHRGMGHEPLAGEPQREDGEAQHDDGGHGGHDEAGGDQRCADAQAVEPEVEFVDLSPQPHQAEAARQGRQRVDEAEAAMGKRELCAQFGVEHGDEKSLAGSGEAGENNTEGEKAPVLTQEGEVIHRRLLVAVVRSTRLMMCSTLLAGAPPPAVRRWRGRGRGGPQPSSLSVQPAG